VRGQAKLVLARISHIDTILYEWVGEMETVSPRNAMVSWESKEDLDGVF
jgi:hypothetical protein